MLHIDVDTVNMWNYYPDKNFTILIFPEFQFSLFFSRTLKVFWYLKKAINTRCKIISQVLVVEILFLNVRKLLKLFNEKLGF